MQYFKKVIGLTVVVALMANMLNQAIIYYSWLIQRDYIVKNLCVEKDEEVNKCQGCCQLEAKLLQAEPQQKENSKTPPIPAGVEKIKDIFHYPALKFNIKKILTLTISSAYKENTYSFLYLANVFRPPKFQCL